MVNASSSPLLASALGSCKSEVREPDRSTTIPTKDVLGLQITMIDPERMAMLYCRTELREDLRNKRSMTKINLAV